MTDQSPDGGVMNYPSLWKRGDQYVELPPEEALKNMILLERMFGVRLPRYGSVDAAVNIAKQTSANGGGSIGRFFTNRLSQKP
ncbi:hypothetical protein BMI85_16095 [Thioclava sp. DLFJ4-1]|nr:hypothetical protein BMI85_16095 [Thioclava sp. DLFJ4-1]